MQATLFQTAKQISLTETIVAVNFRGRWEVYETNSDGIEIFSHYAKPAEALQYYRTK